MFSTSNFQLLTSIFILSWRNLWRNKRRTTIVVSSIFFAAVFAMIMDSFLNGSTDYIINTAVERQTGTLQAMNAQYWSDKTVDNFMEIDNTQLQRWETIPQILRLTPRIESFAMVWNGTRTKPILLVGIDPKRECQFSKLDTRMIAGKYLTNKDSGIVIGNRLAETMNVNVGDTLTLIGQGYHGSSAIGLFRIKGIIKAFDPLLNNGIAYTSITTVQNFINMPNGATYISIVLKDTNEMKKTIAQLQQTANDSSLVYRPWQELIQNTAAGASKDKKSIVIFFYILYVVVGFGLLSTMIMLTNERRKEFAVMTALGMKKSSLIIGLFVEILLMNILGLLLSILVALPIIAYFHYFPITLGGDLKQMMEDMGIEAIIPMALNTHLFIKQIIVVMILALVVTLYPLGKIKSMKIIDSLRN